MSQNSIPIPLYYVPQTFAIQSIVSSGQLTIVTTVMPNNYQPGAYVRLFLPTNQFVWQQLEANIYLITVIDSSSFSIVANTASFPSFTALTNQIPQVKNVGELATTLQSAIYNNGYSPI